MIAACGSWAQPMHGAHPQDTADHPTDIMATACQHSLARALQGRGVGPWKPKMLHLAIECTTCVMAACKCPLTACISCGTRLKLCCATSPRQAPSVPHNCCLPGMLLSGCLMLSLQALSCTSLQTRQCACSILTSTGTKSCRTPPRLISRRMFPARAAATAMVWLSTTGLMECRCRVGCPTQMKSLQVPHVHFWRLRETRAVLHSGMFLCLRGCAVLRSIMSFHQLRPGSGGICYSSS